MCAKGVRAFGGAFHWERLELRGETEEVEGALLNGGGDGDFHEGRSPVDLSATGIESDSGEIGQQGAEAVNGQTVVGPLGARLSRCFW